MSSNLLVRGKRFIAIMLAGFIGTVGLSPAVLAKTDANQPAVEVVFTGRILDDMGRINKLEKRREKYFRKHRGETRRRGFPKLARSRYSKTEFAVERLIPELEDFSVEHFIRRAVLRNVKEMGLENVPARIKVTLQQMRIADYSLAPYRSHSTTMKGVVEVFDKNGDRTGAVNLTWEMIPLFTTDHNYAGREYVFLRESAYVRIAPLTLGFLEKALEHMFPGKDAPGPVFIWPPKTVTR